MPAEETLVAIEGFICKVYSPKTTITDVGKLRWFLFSKEQLQYSKLPPTRDALRQAILRAHYQCLVWNSDTTAKPSIPSPEQYGWKLDDDTWVPVKSLQLPAPLSVLQLIKCNCGKSRCRTTMCSCMKHEIRCSEMCGCCTYGTHATTWMLTEQTIAIQMTWRMSSRLMMMKLT